MTPAAKAATKTAVKRPKTAAKALAPPAPPAAPAQPRMPPAPWQSSSTPATPGTAPVLPPMGQPSSSRRDPSPPAEASGARDFFRSVYEVARKDVLQHIRTKRLLIIALFFLLSLQLVTLILPLSFEEFDAPDGDDPAWENFFVFLHLNASVFGGQFAIQLLCIVLTADAVCSEWSGRTIFLMLSKPVSRTAFVVGKYVGAIVSIVPLVTVLYTLQYLIMTAVYPGQPSGEEFGAFFLMLAMLSLGALVLASVALLFSTLTRSNVQSLVFSLLSVFLLFPILSAIGDIQYDVDRSQAFRNSGSEDPDLPEADEWKYDWSHYVTPSGAMAAAPGLVIPGDTDDDFQFSLAGFIPQHAPQRTWMAVVSGVGFILLFVGLSILRVRTRNFE